MDGGWIWDGWSVHGLLGLLNSGVLLLGLSHLHVLSEARRSRVMYRGLGVTVQSTVASLSYYLLRLAALWIHDGDLSCSLQ